MSYKIKTYGEKKFLCGNHDTANVVQDVLGPDGVKVCESLLAGNRCRNGAFSVLGEAYNERTAIG